MENREMKGLQGKERTAGKGVIKIARNKERKTEKQRYK